MRSGEHGSKARLLELVGYFLRSGFEAGTAKLRVLDQFSQDCSLVSLQPRLDGGEGGIRTPDTLPGMPVFKTGAINHSATSPHQLQFYYRMDCSFLNHSPPEPDHFTTTRLLVTENTPETLFARRPSIFLSPSLSTTPSSVTWPFFTMMRMGLMVGSAYFCNGA